MRVITKADWSGLLSSNFCVYHVYTSTKSNGEKQYSGCWLSAHIERTAQKTIFLHEIRSILHHHALENFTGSFDKGRIVRPQAQIDDDYPYWAKTKGHLSQGRLRYVNITLKNLKSAPTSMKQISKSRSSSSLGRTARLDQDRSQDIDSTPKDSKPAAMGIRLMLRSWESSPPGKVVPINPTGLQDVDTTPEDPKPALTGISLMLKSWTSLSPKKISPPKPSESIVPPLSPGSRWHGRKRRGGHQERSQLNAPSVLRIQSGR